MKNLSIIFLTFFLSLPLLAEDKDVSIQRYDLTQPGDLKLAYGSGLAFKNSNLYGAKYFYILASGSFKITDGKSPAAVQNVPHLALAKLRKKKLQIQARFPIVSENEELNIDPEGIALASDKAIWLADEGGGRLIKISADKGKVQQVLSIGRELPGILSQSQSGRGIEGVAVTPNGNIYSIMQSPLDINKETAASANFIRLLEYNPNNSKSRMLAVPFDKSAYYAPDDIKFGDLQAVDNNRLLTIEQGKSKDGLAVNKIMLLDIREATDISSYKVDGREPEYEAEVAKVFGANRIMPVNKTLLVDLRNYGWKYKKAEGLTLMNPSALAVINDWGDDTSDNELWVINLSEPLISWSAAEWFMIFLIALITIAGMIFIWKILLSFKNESPTGTDR